jgi:hypothetical protein
MSAILEPTDVASDRYAYAGPGRDNPAVPASRSAVSWGAIFGGAAAAGALSLILLLLGTGLGLSSVSPWASEGIDASTFGISSILWITFMQLAASGMGGYLAGRLRTKWAGADTDEVYFRDTAHGFLAWAVATLGTAALLTSVVGSIVGGGVQAGASLAGGAASSAISATAVGAGASAGTAEPGEAEGPMTYFVDSLFRTDGERVRDNPPEEAAASLAEVTRIFANGIRTGELPAEDVEYVGQVVARRTDLSQPEAERRVREAFANLQSTLEETETAAREAADTAREASAYVALWLFISLLIGAFIASWMATFGGRQRDL